MYMYTFGSEEPLEIGDVKGDARHKCVANLLRTTKRCNIRLGDSLLTRAYLVVQTLRELG